MKHVLLITAFLVMSFVAQAQTLKDVMSAMGKDSKIIALTLKGGKLTADSKKAANDLKTNVELAKTLFPDSADTKALQDRYSQLMVDLSSQCDVLITAIESALVMDPTNITPTTEAFKKLMEIRQQGHDEFKL